MDLAEGVGESSSPPRSIGSSGGGGGGAYDIRNDVYNKLLESGNEEVVNNPELFREQLEAHFNSLPSRFHLTFLQLLMIVFYFVLFCFELL